MSRVLMSGVNARVGRILFLDLDTSLTSVCFHLLEVFSFTKIARLDEQESIQHRVVLTFVLQDRTNQHMIDPQLLMRAFLVGGSHEWSRIDPPVTFS